MADQPSLNSLLQWSINASTDASSTANTNSTTAAAAPRDASRGLNAQALQELLGGPSDADLMRAAMTAILAPDVSRDNKAIAWDNLEQLIEQIDNANNLVPLGMWAPLLGELARHGGEDAEADAEARLGAAACVRTAVQNNIKAQETMRAQGGIAALVARVCEDSHVAVRKKAVSALSSEVRNYQPGLDDLLEALPRELGGQQKGVDAGDMEAVDSVIQTLREHAARTE